MLGRSLRRLERCIDFCNLVLQWLQKRCEVTNGRKHNVRASEVFNHYRMSVGQGALSSKDFARMMMLSNIRKLRADGIALYRCTRVESIGKKCTRRAR